MQSVTRDLSYDPASRGTTHCAVLQPRWELVSCVRAYVTRSTLDVNLLPHERHNFYPASLSCSISWTLQGQTELIRVGDQVFNSMATSPVIFSGPHTKPCETRNPGPVQFFLLMLYPDAFQALTGVDLQDQIDRHRPLHEILPPEWQDMASNAMQASNDADRINLIEAFLMPRWQAARPSAKQMWPHLLKDWARALAMRCVTSKAGKSLRQIERRVSQWTGQTHRQLNRLVRGESAFLKARDLHEKGSLSWPQFASESGFSDQSHLCREFRKLTGLQPQTVLDNLDHDERLWIYRAW